jgi:hypothetical protein
VSDHRGATNDLQDEGNYDAAGHETTVLVFVKRGKVRRGALEAVLNVPEDREPERAEQEFAGFAHALARSPTGEKRRYL